MLSKLAISSTALATALVVAGCSNADAGSSASRSDVSQYVGAQGAAGGTGSAATDGSDAGGSDARAAIAAIDPCVLLTKDEIIGQMEASYGPDQLAGFRSAGGTWAITPTPAQEGISKVCQYALTGTVKNGDVRQRSEFKLIVTDGAFVNPDVNNAKKRPIPGVGDEAYFMSRGSMMPYARVGKVAVGMEGFPNTPTAKSGVDLLRMAVARVR